MSANTKIEWTDHTFNPWWGCVEVSPECDNCYARDFAHRLGLKIWGKDAPRRFFGDKHWGEIAKMNRKAERSGQQKRVFWGSMCDLMEDRRDLDQWRSRMFHEIQESPWLIHMLLTKRPQNYTRFLPEAWLANPLPNVWLMTTVGVKSSLWRIDYLKAAPAVVHGLSVEPLLEDLDMLSEHLDGIDWLIIGGESGNKARAFKIDAARRITNEGAMREIAVFMKQLGAQPLVQISPAATGIVKLKDQHGGNWDDWPSSVADLKIRQFPEAKGAA